MTTPAPLKKYRLYDLELTEISLVDRPANPEARVLIIKSHPPHFCNTLNYLDYFLCNVIRGY